MPQQYTQEQLWKLLKKLPEELQSAVFSGETADTIWDICEQNNIDDISELAKLVGDVLLGLLPPSELKKILETEWGMTAEEAKKVFQGIYRHILYPVQLELAKLYPTEEIFGAKPAGASPAAVKPGKAETIPTIGEKSATAGAPAPSVTRKGPDDYRESLD